MKQVDALAGNKGREIRHNVQNEKQHNQRKHKKLQVKIFQFRILVFKKLSINFIFALTNSLILQ